MFRKKIFSALLLLLTVVSLSSCNKDKDNEPKPAATPGLECKINNVAWKAATFNNTLVEAPTAVYPGKRLDIRGTAADGTTLVLTISEPSTTANGGIKVDTYYTNILRNVPPNHVSGTPVKAALGTYMSLITQKVSMSDPEAMEGQIVITACDAAKKTVSGTFFFNAINFDDASVLNFTSGTFTNLSYTVR